MTATVVLALLAIICALGSVYAGVRIANDLRSRGISANPTLVRWMIFKYMAEYKRVTVSETGKVGPLYNQCAAISALAAFFGIAAILVKFLSS
jgi:hypothetical protein